MIHPKIYNTERRPDYTRGGIKEKNDDRVAVQSPVSNSCRLLKLFQKIFNSFPQEFPSVIQDWRVASRAKEILGLPQKEKMDWGGKSYCVLGKEVYKWLQDFETIIGSSSIEAEFIVGSAVVYIVGQPVLREALDLFQSNIPDSHPKKANFFGPMVSKIARKEFSFSDVDIRIKVSPTYNMFDLQHKINQVEGCRTELFDGKVLIVYVGESEKSSLDLVIYTELDTESAFNVDDCKIDIRNSNFEQNLTVLQSTNHWEWWIGHTIGILKSNSTDKVRVYPRLLGQLFKSKVCDQNTEKEIFHAWVEKIDYRLKKDKTALKAQFDKQLTNHDKIPLVNCLLRLSTQQLIRKHTPEFHFVMREAANTDLHPSVSSFMHALFHVMKEKDTDLNMIHALIECIVFLALCEAWNQPFTVKLVMHEGKLVQRVRFRGSFGKRDLLINFDIPASLAELKNASKGQRKKIHEVLHALWADPISQRTEGPLYKKKLQKLTAYHEDLQEIKRLFFRKTDLYKNEFIAAQQSSLAVLEIASSQKAKHLLEVGKAVYKYYLKDLSLRHQLCWKIIYKCIDLRGFSQATELIEMLRKDREDPLDGYPALFAYVIQKDCDSYLLYEACAPFPGDWMDLSQKKSKIPYLIQLMNEMDIPVELFLEMIRLLKFKNPEFNEKTLCKILMHDPQKAHKWVLEKDKPTFVSEEYSKLVSACILECKNNFSAEWIKNYILYRNFIASINQKEAICKYLLAKSLTVQDKANLLQKLEIKEPSLWQNVANEYISQGESWPDFLDSESLVLWQQIVDNADNKALVEKILLMIKPPPQDKPDTIRGLVLIRLLKNWGKKQVDVEILKKLDVTQKIPWEEVIFNATTSEAILKKLYLKSFSYSSALFRAMRPKDPWAATFWVNMMLERHPKIEELFKALTHPLMTDCMRIHPKISLILCKKIAVLKEGIQFIIENFDRDEVDQELIYIMIEACNTFDENGTMGTTVFMKYFNPDIHKCTQHFKQHLGKLVRKIFANPQGDTEAAIRIQKLIKDLANPECLPAKEHFTRLLQNNASDWAASMLNSAPPSELEKIPPQIYIRLLNSTKDLNKRCIWLGSCQNGSNALKQHWELLAQNNCSLEFNSSIKLIECAQRLDIPELKVQKLFVSAMASRHATKVTLTEKTCEYLLAILLKVDYDSACQLWESLRKSHCVNKKNLWKSAFQILQKNTQKPHYRLLHWLLQHPMEEIFPLLEKIAKNPLESRIQSLIFPFIKKEALKNNKNAIKIYWELDLDTDITAEDLEVLQPTPEQCKKTDERLMNTQDQLNRSCMESSAQLLLYSRKFIDSKEALESIYSLLAQYTPLTTNCKGKEKASRILMEDIKSLPTSKELQKLCEVVVDQESLLSNEDKCHLLAFLMLNDLLEKQMWQLVAQLINTSEIKYINFAITSMLPFRSFENCPTRVLFKICDHPEYVADVAMKMDTQTFKDTCRKDYFKGILLGALFVYSQSEAKKFALKFIKFLLPTFSYLETHQETELEHWKMMHPSTDEWAHAKESMSSRLFFRLVSRALTTNNSEILFDPEILQAYFDTIRKFPKKYIFIITSLARLICELVWDKEREIGAIVVGYLLSIVFDEELTVKNDDPSQIYLLFLYYKMSQLMVKFTPHLLSDQQNLATLLQKVSNNIPKEMENLKLECYSAYMNLTGDVEHFYPCLPNAKCRAIRCSIQNLCINPSPENLDKAYHLIVEGTYQVMYISPELREANRSFVQATLEYTDKEKITSRLFLHLCNPNRVDCFEQSKEAAVKNIASMLSNFSSYSKSISTSIEIEPTHIIRKRRLELVYFNMYEIIKSKKLPIFDLIALMNITIFSTLENSYKDFPEELKLVNTFLIEECTKYAHEHPHIYRSEVAVLLCTQVYFPLEPWIPFFVDLNLEPLLMMIKEARIYAETLQKYKGNQKKLIELMPDPTSYNGSDAKLAIYYQWINETYQSFKDEPFNNDTCLWMNHILEILNNCIELSNKVVCLQSLNSTVLTNVDRIIQLNSKISKKNPEFANRWLASFIKSLEPHFCEHDCFLNVFDEKLQNLITLELLPSLPLIEELSAKLSPAHKKRNCIDAHYKLLTLGCKDRAIIEKAVANIGELDDKEAVTPSSKALRSRIVNYDNVISAEVVLKMEYVYKIGIEHVLDYLKVDSDKDLFLKKLQEFRFYTEPIRVTSNTKLPQEMFELFYKYIGHFTDDNVLFEVMEFLHFQFLILRKLGLTTSIHVWADNILCYTMLSVFFGKDEKCTHNNKYLNEIRDNMLQGFQHVECDPAFFSTILSYPHLIKCGFLVQHQHWESKFVQYCRTKCSTDSRFKDAYFCVLNEIIKDLKHFITLRPQQKNWYKEKIYTVESEIKFIEDANRLGLKFYSHK